MPNIQKSRNDARHQNDDQNEQEAESAFRQANIFISFQHLCASLNCCREN